MKTIIKLAAILAILAVAAAAIGMTIVVVASF